MGFGFEIDEAGPVKLTERAITSIRFGSGIPQDSNTRTISNGVLIKIWGKLLFPLGSEKQDSTFNLAQWSLAPSKSPDSHRNVKVDVASAPQIMRQIILPNTFMVGYAEELGGETGIGSFYLHIKQKKDQTVKVTIDSELSA